MIRTHPTCAAEETTERNSAMSVKYRHLKGDVNQVDSIINSFDSEDVREHLGTIVRLSEIPVIQDDQLDDDVDNISEKMVFKRAIALALYYELQATNDKAAKKQIAETLANRILKMSPRASRSDAALKEELKKQNILVLKYSPYTEIVNKTIKALIERLADINKLDPRYQVAHIEKIKRECYQSLFYLSKDYDLSLDPAEQPFNIAVMHDNKTKAILRNFLKQKDDFYLDRYEQVRNTFMHYLKKQGYLTLDQIITAVPGTSSKFDTNTVELLEQLNFLGGDRILWDYYNAYFNIPKGEQPEDPKAALDQFIKSVHNNVTELQPQNLRPHGITDEQKEKAIVMSIKKVANRFSRRNHLSYKLTDTHLTTQYVDKVKSLAEICEPSIIAYFAEKYTQQYKSRYKKPAKLKAFVDQLAQDKYNQQRLYLERFPEKPQKNQLAELEKLHGKLQAIYKNHLTDNQLIEMFRGYYMSQGLQETKLFEKLRNPGAPEVQRAARKKLDKLFHGNFAAVIAKNGQKHLFEIDPNNKETEAGYYLESVKNLPMTYNDYNYRNNKARLAKASRLSSLSLAAGQGITGVFALTNLLFIAVMGMNPLLAFILASGIGLTTFYLNNKLFYQDVLDTLIQFVIKRDFFNGKKTWYGIAGMVAVLGLAAGMSFVMGAMTFTAALTVPLWAWSVPLATGIALYFGGVTFVGFVGLMYVAFSSVCDKLVQGISAALDNYKSFISRAINEASPKPLSLYFKNSYFMDKVKGVFYALKKVSYSPLKGILLGSLYTLVSPFTAKSPSSFKYLKLLIEKREKELEDLKAAIKNAKLAGENKATLANGIELPQAEWDKEIANLTNKINLLKQPSFTQLYMHLKTFWRNPLDFDQNKLQEARNRELNWDAKTAKQKRNFRQQQKLEELVTARQNAGEMVSDKERESMRKKIARDEKIKRGSYVVSLVTKPFIALPFAAVMLVLGTVATLVGWQPLFVDFLTTWLPLNQAVATAISTVMIFGCTAVVDGAFNMLNEMKFFDWVSDVTASIATRVAVTTGEMCSSVVKGIIGLRHPIDSYNKLKNNLSDFGSRTSAAVVNAYDNPRKNLLPLLQFVLVDVLFNGFCLFANGSGFAALSLAGAKTPVAKAKAFSTVLVASLSCNTITGIVPSVRARTPNCDINHITTRKAQYQQSLRKRFAPARGGNEGDGQPPAERARAAAGFKRMPAQEYQDPRGQGEFELRAGRGIADVEAPDGIVGDVAAELGAVL